MNFPTVNSGLLQASRLVAHAHHSLNPTKDKMDLYNPVKCGRHAATFQQIGHEL